MSVGHVHGPEGETGTVQGTIVAAGGVQKRAWNIAVSTGFRPSRLADSTRVPSPSCSRSRSKTRSRSREREREREREKKLAYDASISAVQVSPAHVHAGTPRAAWGYHVHPNATPLRMTTACLLSFNPVPCKQF